MTSSPTAPTFTRDGLWLGIRLALPVLPGLAAYCLAFGAAAAHTGLSPAASVAMSAFVYAGAAQMLSLELWRDLWSPAALVTVALVTMTVNARFVLMGASIQPWLRGAPGALTAANLFVLTDASWLIATRYRADGGRDLGVLLGSGLVIWVVWVGMTVPGYYVGSMVADTRAAALDLVLPLFFCVMAVPLWRGVRRTGLPWLVAGLVAVAVQALVPGYVFIVAGALAGAAAGAWLDE